MISSTFKISFPPVIYLEFFGSKVKTQLFKSRCDPRVTTPLISTQAFQQCFRVPQIRHSVFPDLMTNTPISGFLRGCQEHGRPELSRPPVCAFRDAESPTSSFPQGCSALPPAALYEQTEHHTAGSGQVCLQPPRSFITGLSASKTLLLLSSLLLPSISGHL